MERMADQDIKFKFRVHQHVLHFIDEIPYPATISLRLRALVGRWDSTPVPAYRVVYASGNVNYCYEDALEA